MTTFYAGYPVGLMIEKAIMPGCMVTLQSPLVERPLWITRLRWDCRGDGLWLMGAKLHRTPLVREMPSVPILALFGQGVWRFRRRFVQPGVHLSIDVQNFSGGSLYPGPIAFWGTPDGDPKFWDEQDALNPVF